MYHFTVKTSHAEAVYLHQAFLIATMSVFCHKTMIIFCRLSNKGDNII